MNDFLLAGVSVRPRLNEIEGEHGCERLPAKFIDVLVALAERPGLVWRKAELLERVWNDPVVGDEALSHAIWMLRKTLRDDAKRPTFIETIPRRGYRLLPTPQWLANDTGCTPAPDSVLAIELAPLAPMAAAVTRPYRALRTVLASTLSAFAIVVGAILFTVLATRSAAIPKASIFHTGGPISALVAMGDGAVLLNSEDGFLYAADGAGAERWRKPFGSPWNSPAFVADDAIYVGSNDGYVYALERVGGRELWRHNVGQRVHSMPLALGDRVIVGAKAGRIQALSRRDGRVLWRAQVAGDVVGPVIALGARVLLTINDGSVISINPTDGSVLWQRRLPGPLSDLVAMGEDSVALASDSGFVIALAALDGSSRWQVELDGAGTNPLYDGSSIYAVGRYGTIAALRARDGHQLWQQQFAPGDRLDPTLWSGRLVVGMADHRVGLLNRGTGNLEHTIALPSASRRVLGTAANLWIAGADTSALILNTSAFDATLSTLVVASDGGLHSQTETTATRVVLEPLRANVSMPQLTWSARVIGNAQDASPAADGVAYVGDESGLSAIDEQGRTRWRLALSKPIGTAPVIAGDRLLFGCRDHYVYALNLHNGKQLWRFQTGADVIATPVVDGERVLVGSSDKRMYALRLEDGKVAWTFSTQGPLHGAAAISGDQVIFGSGDENVYALDVGNGRERWRYRARDWVVAQPVIAGARVFVGVANGDFLALAVASGKELWRFHSEGKIWFAPAAATDLVYFGSGDGYIYALAQASGAERWRFRTGAGAEGSVVFRDGVLYAGSHDASLYALDGNNGEALWRLRTGGSVWNPGLAGNTLLVPSADQHVYALRLQPASN